MTANVQHAALRAAKGQPLPFAHVCGTQVVLVTTLANDAVKGTLTGNLQSRVFSSAGLAKRVAARVLDDVRAWPEHASSILALSEMYATASMRHARWRARRELVA
jgi:hypothetical protein